MKPNIVGKRIGLGLTLALVAMMLGARVSNAGSITYTVNQTYGPATVTGTITTDGTIGTITAADITSFDLTLTDTSSDVFNYTSSVFSAGSDITATSTDLLFNYSSSTAGYLLFQPVYGDGETYVCLATAGELPLCVPGESIVPVAYGDATDGLDETITGNDVFASVVGTNSGVPEPGTYGLMLAGLGLLAAMRKRSLPENR